MYDVVWCLGVKQWYTLLSLTTLRMAYLRLLFGFFWIFVLFAYIK